MAKLLVVEDDEDNRELFAFKLESYGHDVHIASSAEEAIQLVKAGLEPDVAVLDVGLPGQDGFDLLCQLRMNTPLRDRLLPAVFVSAYSDPDHIAVGRLLGAVYLPKPCEMTSLQHAIAEGMSMTLADTRTELP